MQKAIDVSNPSAVHTVNNNTPSLRDQFAMAALQGMVGKLNFHSDQNHAAEFAYGFADAMMEARER